MLEDMTIYSDHCTPDDSCAPHDLPLHCRSAQRNLELGGRSDDSCRADRRIRWKERTNKGGRSIQPTCLEVLLVPGT